MKGHEQTNPAYKDHRDPIMREIYWEERCRLAETLLKRHVISNKEIGRACHIYDLEEKVKTLQNQITCQRGAAEYRNRQLRAANIIISCTGGCDTGIIGSKDQINEEVVCEVETIAKRLRHWWNNYHHRQKNKSKS